MTIKEGQIEIKHSTLDRALANNLTQKIELAKNATLAQVTVAKRQSSDSLPTRCKVASA